MAARLPLEWASTCYLPVKIMTVEAAPDLPVQALPGTAAFTFGTKAETLEQLRPYVREAIIPPVCYFTVSAWGASRPALLDDIVNRFGEVTLAVRSSAILEDGAGQSMAGAFTSKLNIDGASRQALASAIDEVAISLSGNPHDQILIQPMADNIAVSGVMMTFDMVHGAPYYCIDYDDESGRTDIVTAGNGVHKGLFVYRYADGSMIRSPRVRRFLRLARELEAICDCPALDIEFGLSRTGQLFLFQVRRIAASNNWHPVTERRVKRQLAFVEEFVRDASLNRQGVLGDRTILAIMPDWNPAEIIGTTPRQLAASLYRLLITNDVWCHARAAMGYRLSADPELMVLINNHPYIDVRNSFNSFIPASVPEALGNKLVNAWLDRLEAHPEFHDKIEFEVVPTCFDFCFEKDFQARYAGLLDEREFNLYREALLRLTRSCLTPGPENTLDQALESALALERLQFPKVVQASGQAHLGRAAMLLRECRKSGTLSFAIAARHAFIAEALLRSTMRCGALSDHRLAEFKRSIHTVTGNLVSDYAMVCRGQLQRSAFLARYGHLRPGTYEITSLRYDERDDLFLEEDMALPAPDAPGFVLSAKERQAINRLLERAGLDVINADQLMAYARRAIAGREQVKFIFTRGLSDALSALTKWGGAHGLSRDDLSHLDWELIEKSLHQPVMDEVDRYYLDFVESGRKSIAAAYGFRLGHILFSIRDIYVATLNRSVPNFIGTGSAIGRIVVLSANSVASINIKDRIVCIENADPGFDWIFTKGPRALITCFGGANSHMAIRCAELGLPAAIGCGDQIYQRITRVGSVELNCQGKILRPIHA